MPTSPLIIGHRGMGKLHDDSPYGENSISGLLRALELGADGVEFDVRLTSDDQVVIHHDARLSRTTLHEDDESRPLLNAEVAKHTAERLNRIKLKRGSGDVIPTLPQVLSAVGAAHPTSVLWIEIKTLESDGAQLRLVERVLEDLDTSLPEWPGRVWFISFSLQALRYVRLRCPEARIALLAKLAPRRTIRLAHEHGFQAVGVHTTLADSKLLARARGADLQLVAGSPRKERPLRRLLALDDLSAICTDAVELALRLRDKALGRIDPADTEPRCTGLVLSLEEPALGEVSALAREHLRQAGVPDPLGWSVTVSRHTGPGLELDLAPPVHVHLSPPQAWQLALHLRGRPGVLDVEPSFELYLSTQTPAEEAPSGRDEERDWAPRFIRAPAAWTRSRGAGVRIAHPDSGYRRHPQLPLERLLLTLAYDFVEGDGLAEADQGGDHGLGTASVIVSPEDPAGAVGVTGVAPAADLVPLRVTRPHGVLPSPVLLWSGSRRLGWALDRAADPRTQCHVVSISLGWLPSRALRRAVRRAIAADLIVVAAAGNYVRLVVAPARYEEVIAVAGCDAHSRPWLYSSWGSAVDLTGPAKNVWKAAYAGDWQTVEPSSGTSFATAMTAGVAALWLSFHGRDALLAKYKPAGIRLQTVFAWVVTRSASPFPDPPPEGMGAGILDAEAALDCPLPSVDALRADPGSKAREAASRSAPWQPRPPILEAEELLGPDVVATLSGMTGADRETLLGLDQTTQDELLFWLEVENLRGEADKEAPLDLDRLSPHARARLGR